MRLACTTTETTRKKKFEGTALHKAAATENMEVLKLLLNQPAGIDILDPIGGIPLEKAREGNQQETVELLALEVAGS